MIQHAPLRRSRRSPPRPLALRWWAGPEPVDDIALDAPLAAVTLDRSGSNAARSGDDVTVCCDALMHALDTLNPSRPIPGSRSTRTASASSPSQDAWLISLSSATTTRQKLSGLPDDVV